jgi:transposase
MAQSRRAATQGLPADGDSDVVLEQLAVAPGPQHNLLVCSPFLPKLRDCWLPADRGFDADDFRHRLDDQGVRTCIPSRSGRRWPSRLSRRLDRQRHTVENFFVRIKRYRRIATPPPWVGQHPIVRDRWRVYS